MDVATPKKAVVLAVGGDDLVERPGFPHGAAHHLRRLDALSVIGKGDDSGRKALQVRQRLPLLSPGDGAVGVDGNDGGPVNEPLLDGKIFRAVRHRIQVWHGAHRRIAPPGRRPGAGGDGLLIRKSRLSEMHMHITKAGENGIF